ncbi:WXG100 family type VII secretion target [Streptomyces sp. NBC_01803]|uniref:WXG100 family type VII secretion target n=1 Tax=Streptomyces sp. NBC_01803 TaxID=2975946 RepID=UPI002DD7A83F|nr:WXG100 family type VII secretion target [Streptomyces sp. NBC_01803]WSA43916.1 WXG100 family type VII secretion target [Streptomyces sp. NBC_01803]
MSTPMPGGNSDLRQEGEAIDRVLAALEREAGVLDANRRELSSVSDELAAQWGGGAAGQFNAGQNQFGLDLDRLIKAMGNLHELVRLSRDGFQAEEAEQVAALRTVNAGLGGPGNPNLNF